MARRPQSIAAGDCADARRRAGTELHHGDVGMHSATNWRLLFAGQPRRAARLLHHRSTTRQHHTYEDLLLETSTVTHGNTDHPQQPHTGRSFE
ncbi:hypothetical protein ACFP1Z_12570 [Streptomyces gamaensis]|uniref:Uncharacterized protein n=1 Tax=Streptomyces gamaensis TaxID=1763542 RepID=A0ABW0YXT0_9ACTN